jgi:arylsulfatase A-like enzyme
MASERELLEARALTAGMITMIDDAVGEIIATLEATGELDNTIVIFTSDHGDYLGDLNLLLKGPNPRRSINNVPFIWADPRAGDQVTRSDLASAVDIAPTILSAAGCVPYYGIQGHDLFAGSRRDMLMIEHEDNKPTPGFTAPANLRTLMTREHRITVYHGVEWGELYDLQADPGELCNLWDDPASLQVKTDLLQRLSQSLVAAVDPSPWPSRLA